MSVVVPGLPATEPRVDLAGEIVVPSLKPLDYKALLAAATRFDLGKRWAERSRPWIVVERSHCDGGWLVAKSPAIHGELDYFDTAPLGSCPDGFEPGARDQCLRFGLAELRKMRPLHIFYNGHDWVIAESAEDARLLYCEFIGGESDLTDDDWDQLPDDKPFGLAEECGNNHRPKPDADAEDVENGELEAFTCGDPNCKDGVVRTTKTCAAWCVEHGEGYFASDDF